MNAVQVRGATLDDLPAVSALAEALVELHHGFDPRRFLRVPGVAEGYLKWFTRELENPDAIILVATGAEGLVGYVYGRVEPRDWNMLLDRHAALHDIYVSAEARGRGVAEALVDAFAERARALGAPRVVLHTASQNEAAQRLFARLGFRPTMIEMTREL
ncbi:MAG: GNAT family N-acetyltransferase [Polyangiales bacterium]